jgi:hypothetical protein
MKQPGWNFLRSLLLKVRQLSKVIYRVLQYIIQSIHTVYPAVHEGCYPSTLAEM